MARLPAFAIIALLSPCLLAVGFASPVSSAQPPSHGHAPHVPHQPISAPAGHGPNPTVPGISGKPGANKHLSAPNGKKQHDAIHLPSQVTGARHPGKASPANQGTDAQQAATVTPLIPDGKAAHRRPPPQEMTVAPTVTLAAPRQTAVLFSPLVSVPTVPDFGRITLRGPDAVFHLAHP